MRFGVEHEFAAPGAKVAAVLCDPAFHTELDLPDLSRPEVVASSDDGTARMLRLRYQYIGQLDPIARRIVGGRTLAWIQELRLDTETLTGALSFSAEEDPGRLNGAAEVAITAVGAASAAGDELPATSMSAFRSSAVPPSDGSCPVSSAGSTWKPRRCRRSSRRVRERSPLQPVMPAGTLRTRAPGESDAGRAARR